MDYRQLDSMIDALRAQVHAANPQKGYWKELWALAGQIGAGFKGVRYETREAKDAAWKRFQELRQQANERSDASKQEMEARQKEWEKKKDRSEQALRSIEGRAAGAAPRSGLERSLDEALRVTLLLPLTIIEKVLNKVLGLREKTAFEEARDELRQCSATLKEAWQTFMDRKRELLPADKAKCHETLTRAQERLNEAWAQLKGAQDSFYTAQRAAHEERQREWERKQAAYDERAQANIDKLEANLDKARSALSRQEAHLEKLESDYSSAWNDSFKEKCSGWIDEAKDKIADIRASIERMEGWLDEQRRKLK